MKFRSFQISLITTLILALSIELPNAQSLSDYRELQMRKDPPRVYYDIHSAVRDSSIEVLIPFNIEHRFVNFRQVESGSYETSVTVSVDIFSSSRNTEAPTDDAPVTWDLLESLTWTTEKTVADFEATNASDKFIQGFLRAELDAGRYQSLFRITDRATGRELRGKRSTFRVPSVDDHIEFFLTSPKSQTSATQKENTYQLINEGGNISYGEAVDLLIATPPSVADSRSQLELVVTRLNINSKNNDTTEVGVQSRISLTKAERTPSASVHLIQPEENDPIFLKEISSTASDLLHISLESEAWPTSHYRIELKNTEGDSVLHSRVIQSYWKNMPVPLLSLDFSVEMLRFIMDKEKFKKIEKADREKKLELFNEFWKPRDPTPSTHKNELQAEYYRRVETAMEEYTELSRPGFRTDRGKIYILYGEPDSVTREFPEQNRVIETWNYPDNTFRFRSSGGFDSFELISQ